MKGHDPEVAPPDAAVDEALSAAFGHGTIEYKRYVEAARLDHGPLSVVEPIHQATS
jgi:hypothetical protein